MTPLQQGYDIGNRIASSHETPIVATFARFADDDVQNALAVGFVDCSAADYSQRLVGIVAALESRGHSAILVPVTTQEILDAMAEHGFHNDPDGFAAALASITRSRP